MAHHSSTKRVDEVLDVAATPDCLAFPFDGCGQLVVAHTIPDRVSMAAKERGNLVHVEEEGLELIYVIVHDGS